MHPRVPWTLAIAALTACGPARAPLDASDTGSAHDTSTAETAVHTASTTALPAPTTGTILGSDGSTTPSTTTNYASTGASTTGGATFLLEPDGGSAAKVECDLFDHDCPEGQRCTSYSSNGWGSWDSTKCVPVMDDPKHPGGTCTVEGNGLSGIDDCDAESYCWVTHLGNTGTCAALCKGTPEAPFCEQLWKECLITGDGVLVLCLGCHPLVQDCGPDETCIDHLDTVFFSCVEDVSGNEGQQHDPCESPDACDAGLTCADPTSASECDPNASGCCQPFCDLSDPDPDANCGGIGQVCLPFFERIPPEYANIGRCTLPG